MSRVVVTGGLGFIGSHVADGFLAAGHSVHIIDSMVAAVVDGAEYEAHPRCTLVRASVEDYLANGGSFSGADRIVHAAARLGAAGVIRLAGTLGRDLVMSTSAVIQAAIRHDVPLCVFSSAEVYGRSGVLAESEDLRVPASYNARIEYAVGKTLTEIMALNSRSHGLRAVVIRPFNVAGARQSAAGGHVLPTFVQQALAGTPITVFGSGRQSRAFCAASDLSDFLIGQMDAAIAAGAGVVNIGNRDNEITILELAHRVRELARSDSEISLVDPKTIHGPAYFEAESFRKCPDLATASALGWRPRVGMDKLIRDTIDYYRSRASTAWRPTAAVAQPASPWVQPGP